VTPPEVGEAAPGFELRDEHGQLVALSSHRGRRAVLLVFYPYAFSRVCTSELGELRDAWAAFDRDDLAVLAVSCDPVFTLRAYAEAERLPFALLSDFWPHGEVARAYGAFDDLHGCATRSSYLVDLTGTVRWTVHSPVGQGRDPGEYAAAVAGLLGGPGS
jgi:peroxiredoxin